MPVEKNPGRRNSPSLAHLHGINAVTRPSRPRSSIQLESRVLKCRLNSRRIRSTIFATSEISAEFNADFVIIGAIAYKLYFPDEGRFTADIDAVIALDSDEFVEFARRLEEFGWKRDPNLEHRWRSQRGSYFDLLPAGPQLRRAKQI